MVVRIVDRKHLVGERFETAAQHVVDAQRVVETAERMRIARPALTEGVAQPPRHRAVDIRHGRIVEIAADDPPRARRTHDLRDAVDLRGPKHAILAQTGHDTADFGLARCVREKLMAGDELVVRSVDGRRAQVVVENPHGVLAHNHVGPDRRRRRQHGVRTQDAVFAQDGQRRAIDRIRGLRASEVRDLVLLAQQRKLLGLLREAGIELLEADQVRSLLLDQAQDVVDAAPAVLAVETAHVVAHNLDSSAVEGRLRGIAAADFRTPEERDLEKPRHDDDQHRPGAHPAPADDPVERQHDRRDVDRRSGQPQHGKEPHAARIDIGDEIGENHRRAHGQRHERQRQIDEPHDETAAPFPRRASPVSVIVIGSHRLKTDRSPAFPPMQQQESPQHAAHMGEMGHVAHAPPSEEQLDDGIDDDEPLGLHRNRRNQQHDDRIGMHHAERQQQAHHRARRADQQQRQLAERQRREVLDQRRTHAADHVEGQETLRAEFVFERTPEHPQCEHVEEDMFEIGMQEHVGDELVGMEIGRSQRQGAILHDRVADGQQRRGHVNQYIDDYQILDHRRGLKIAVHAF